MCALKFESESSFSFFHIILSKKKSLSTRILILVCSIYNTPCVKDNDSSEPNIFSKGQDNVFFFSTGGRRRNFLSMHVPWGWRARSFSRMTHRTDRGLVVFRAALALLLRGTPETLLAPARSRKVSALCSLAADSYDDYSHFSATSIIFCSCAIASSIRMFFSSRYKSKARTVLAIRGEIVCRNKRKKMRETCEKTGHL